jgi:MFS family permease
MTSTARRQILFINAGHCLTHYSLLILPTAVLAMVRPGGPFGSEYGPILALATGMFVLYGAGSLPQGWLAARLGCRALMAAFFFGTGLSLIIGGLSSTPLALGTSLAAAGLFAAIYHPIGTAMLVDVAGDKPGRALGVNGVFGNLGVALAPIVSAFLAQRLGWHAAFLGPGALCVAVGIAFVREPVFDHHAHSASTPFPDVPAALIRRAVIVLLLIAVVSGLVFNAFTLLLPKLMQERLASNPQLLPVVGSLAFLVILCGALTQFTIGRLIDGTTLKRVFLPLSIVLAPAMGVLSFARGWPSLVLAAMVAAAIFGQVTVNETMTARYISPALRTRMYSIRFFVGFLGGSIAAPLVGFIHERTGNLVVVIAILAAFALITLGCALFFPDRREELQPGSWSAAALAPAE